MPSAEDTTPRQVNLKSSNSNIQATPSHTRFECDENSLAVSLLIGLEHRRTARPFSELASKYGLSPEAAAMALSQAMGDMALALGSYHRDIDTPLPGPVSKSVRKKGSPGP